MTVGPETFIAAMLAEAGMVALSPDKAGARYPVVDLDWIRDSGAAAVLLSSEPYRFGERHASELAAALGRDGGGPACLTIDGEMTSWYGSRAIDGLSYLLEFRAGLDERLAAVAGRAEGPEQAATMGVTR